MLQPFAELILDTVARTSHSRTLRAASLDHELVYNTMEYYPVVVFFLDQVCEVFYSVWGKIVIEFDFECAHGCFKNCSLPFCSSLCLRCRSWAGRERFQERGYSDKER